MFDLSWLQASTAEVLAAAPPGWKRSRLPRRDLVAIGASLAAIVVASIAGAVVGGIDEWVGFAVLGAFALIAYSLFAYVYAAVRRRREPDELRFAWTAGANGLRYLRGALPSGGTMIMRIGHSLTGDRHFGSAGRGEFGVLQYSTGYGRGEERHTWHYIAARLPAPLPHLVLDAAANNRPVFGSSDLPRVFDKRQRVSLEGGFDRRFQLYAPAEYAQDALYVFTPDVMAAFIDNAAAYDVEIVDDTVMFFSEGGVDYRRAEPWTDAERILTAVVPVLAERARRYRDERVAGQPPRAIDQDAAARETAGAAAGRAGDADALTGASAAAPTIAAAGRRLASHRAFGWAGAAVVFVLAMALLLRGL